MTSDTKPRLLSTKAMTLRHLAPLIATASIDVGHLISRGNWRTRGPVVTGFLAATYQGGALIVRSSAAGEDTAKASAAGRYDSVAVPEHADSAVLQAAIDRVFSSYGDDRDDSYVFVQRYIDAVAAAAVVTTRVAATGAPYYVLAVDEVSGTSDAVTSGRATAPRTWYLAHGKPAANIPPLVRQLMRTVEAVQNTTGSDELDLELLVDADRRTHLLQVRPLVLADHPSPASDRAVARAVETCAHRLAAEQRNGHPQLLGLPPWFSNMADWNPAEMIGQRPRPLAMSLYREVITNRSWAIQRAQYGYRDLRGVRLLHEFAGQPYIDVRASLLSFIPASLPFAAARRIVAHQLDHVAAMPHLHDRIEFDVATTAATFDLDDRLDQLTDDADLLAVHRSELRSALSAITVAGMRRFARDAWQVELASARRAMCLQGYAADPLRRVDALLTGIQKAIAVPFAHTARAAFLATAFTRSALTTGLASPDSVDQFMRSLSTVSAGLRADGAAVARGTIDWEVFVQVYGDLRPGTYDPATPRYRDAPDLYLRPFVTDTHHPAPGMRLDSDGPLFTAAAKTVTAELNRLGLEYNAKALTGFIRSAIGARELGKFELSAWISDILTGLLQAGDQLGHTPDDVAFWRLGDVRGLSEGSLSPARLRDRVEVRRERYAVTQRVHLPATMADPLEVRCFATEPGQPTYVGTGATTGPVRLDPRPGDNLDGIVVLTSADPGFEWLFSRPVKGIVTLYGGANSHMAVRCAEAGVPAAMGVGQAIYDQLASAHVVRLDCAAQTIEIVS